MKPWDIIERKELVNASPFLKLYRETVRLENGEQINDYYTIDQQDYIAVFAMISPQEILGIRHYKHGAKKINLGLPSGYIEGCESPLSAAKRELLEETGYIANDWRPLGTFVVDGNRGCGNVHVFFARDLVKKQEPASGDLETMSLERINLVQLPELLETGVVATLGAAIGISLGLLKIKSSLEEG
ncbi:MAG: NUDIX hydrolase [Methanoregula sp.]